MKPSSSQKFDPLGLTLGLLVLLTLYGQSFLDMKSISFVVFHGFSICTIGLYFLYGGTKKLRQHEEQHEHAHWYTQPSILVALGAFFLLPHWFLEIVEGTVIVNSFPPAVEIALFAPTTVCYLASGFFFFRWFRSM